MKIDYFFYNERHDEAIAVEHFLLLLKKLKLGILNVNYHESWVEDITLSVEYKNQKPPAT